MQKISADRSCSATEAELQAALFTASNKVGWSNCPTQLWMDIYHGMRLLLQNTHQSV